MKYQDYIEPVQAPGASLVGANVNPRTGLATDYLNHFNEAIMLLELLPTCPECLSDFLAWRPLSYCEHFTASHLRGRDLVIAAYGDAEPALRERLGMLVGTMTAVLLATQEAMRDTMADAAVGMIATLAVDSLRSLVARAGAVINGTADESEPLSPQGVVDDLMKQLYP